ncbi:hypothetical protein ACHQM5_001046 [Ranunculus cassubicifolius]
MPMKNQTFFLEEWLKTNTGTIKSVTKPSPSSSARAIIQAWAELRDCLQRESFQHHHFQSLQTLLNSQTSLHVADPQAKLLLSILSSPQIFPTPQSYPLFFKLLYIWLRKSSKPFASHVELAISVVTRLLSTQFDEEAGCLVVSEGVLLLGSLSSIPILSESSKRACLELLFRLVEEKQKLIGSCKEFVPEVLAGIGYALSSSEAVYFGRILSSLFGIWNEGGISATLTHGLMILHLFEWVLSGYVASRTTQKIEGICREILGIHKLNEVPFAVVMAAAGSLRALNRIGPNYTRFGIGLHLKNSFEECVESVARDVVARTLNFSNLGDSCSDRLVVQCLAVGVTRGGLASYCAPLVPCLVSALLVEIFPLRSFYTKIIEYPQGSSSELGSAEVRRHINSVLFKEAGSITRTFCNQYILADEENKRMVENLVWKHCRDLYSGHQQVALLLQGSGKGLLDDLEKIAESCFLMIVIFASVVTKQILNTGCSVERKSEISVRILISFSCVEYFRRIRLPEYTDTIRGVVASVQENDSSCLSFIESIPSYAELTNHSGSLGMEKEYVWSRNDVQTARILFYLRVIPTCIERIPTPVFRRLVVPTMFLYMGHPNGKLARASHSVFVAFMGSGKDANVEDRALLKEQLVFYYIQRALEGYPGVTPFEGLASGVVSLVRHLPAGSPTIFYCISTLAEKARSLCGEMVTQDSDMWRNWEGDSESSKKLVELLLRLLPLVDIQVLPSLMKLLAQFIVELPKDGQNMVLDEIHSLVAESDDVTRKPTLVSWLQSLSFLCSQTPNNKSTMVSRRKGADVFAESTDMLDLNRTSARL